LPDMNGSTPANNVALATIAADSLVGCEPEPHKTDDLLPISSPWREDHETVHSIGESGSLSDLSKGTDGNAEQTGFTTSSSHAVIFMQEGLEANLPQSISNGRDAPAESASFPLDRLQRAAGDASKVSVQEPGSAEKPDMLTSTETAVTHPDTWEEGPKSNRVKGTGPPNN
jgi:hypothetical protein